MNWIKIIFPLIIRKARCANQNLCHFSNSGNVNFDGASRSLLVKDHLYDCAFDKIVLMSWGISIALNFKGSETSKQILFSNPFTIRALSERREISCRNNTTLSEISSIYVTISIHSLYLPGRWYLHPVSKRPKIIPLSFHRLPKARLRDWKNTWLLASIHL